MKNEDLHKAFISLVKEHEAIIFKACYLYADTEANRQDLYQEIVIQVWQGFPKFRGDAKFSTWLYQVAINTALTFLRKEKRSPLTFSPDGTLPDVADKNSGQEHTEQLELLYNAIKHLSDIEKALVMLYLDGKNYDEMEDIMGIANGALRVKMTRIKEKLRTIIKNN